MRRRAACLWVLTCTQAAAGPAHATDSAPMRLHVGPARAVKTLSAASRLAVAGSVIEVDAGEYDADVAVWTSDNLTISAIGGRVRLRAHGVAAERKAIWVVRATGMRVEGFDFLGAAVPDRNGAGIRLESGSLHVRDCRFLHNEMGLLTANNPAIVLEVENCEFAHNQRPDGHNHNLYAGRIARLSVSGSYFHHAHTGHLLKSRAAENYIHYNRLTDEDGGSASYELEFPNGGLAYVVGNIIEQGPDTQNKHLISFGAEGYTWPRNEIHLAHNTLVDRAARNGIFLRAAPGAGAIRAVNNILVGPGSLELAGPGEYRGNFKAAMHDFVQADAYDYRLASRSALTGRAMTVDSPADQRLQQRREYLHPHSSRPLVGRPHNPGAMQQSTDIPSK
jgi:hypothetical protein